MKKSRKSREQHWDRLSELPDSIIFEIFGFLPMRAFVQTTVLSKRWNNLWTTTPYLNFHSRYHSFEFINRALTLWKGFKILKLKISICDDDLWVRLAKDHGVEELYLDNFGELYCVPQNLYSCSSLKVLSLLSCKLQIDGNVQWNQLRSLTIERCIVDEDLIEQVVCGSPHLEVLILIFCDYFNLSFRSSSLKKLSIHREYCFDTVDNIIDDIGELKIWAPNLETLDFLGMPYGKYSLVNVSSVTHLTLDFSRYIDEFDDAFLDEIFGQIFPAIQHVEKLTLSSDHDSDRCIKVLGAMIDQKCLLSPLSNLKSLIIKNKNVSTGGFEQILSLLWIFPQLNCLVVQYNYRPLNLPAIHYNSLLHIETNLPNSFLLQLRTVEIAGIVGIASYYTCGCSLVLNPFIEILLKRASNLQKMVFRGPLNSALVKRAVRLPRASPTAVFIASPDHY